MEIKFKNININNSKISFTLNNKYTNGIATSNIEIIKDLLYINKIHEGEILIDDINVNDNFINIKNKISIIENNDNYLYFDTIYELMYYELRVKKIKTNNPKKKIKDALRIVDLNESFLKKNIYEISLSEKWKIKLAIGLLSNPNIIILDDSFKTLDKINSHNIYITIQKIKDKYNKTIIMVSNDINLLYKYSEYLIIIKKFNILYSGKTKDITKKIDYLCENKIEIPEIIQITQLAKNKKNVKISYHKDIRDLIKDIYKHV